MMIIPSINLNTYRINFKNNCDTIPTQTTGVSKSEQDVFIKTIQVSQKNEKQLAIEELYNKVYNEFIQNNPVLKELNIPKPNLKLEDISANAAYDFCSNTITIRNDFNDDFYFVCSKDYKEGEGRVLVVSQKELDKFLENNQEEDIEYKKLNNEEKSIIQKSYISHELRHYLQEHLLANTKGCEIALEERKKNLNEYIETSQEYIDLLNEELEQNPQNTDLIEEIRVATKELNDFKKINAYLLNLQHKGIFDENKTINFSLIENDDRKWSIKQHMSIASLQYDNSSATEYEISPLELDARRYQIEIACKESKKSQNISKIFSDYLLEEMLDIEANYKNMLKVYPALIEN